MKLAQLIPAISTLYELRKPGFIWGPPGIGKSEAVAQATRKLKIDLIDFRTLLRDPTDIKGFPIPDLKAGVMRFLRDSELPTKGTGILLFDEMNAGTAAVMAACMQLTLKNHKGEFAIGEYVLPKGWSVMAAGNRESDRAVANRIPTALANRFVHLDAESDNDAWIDWAINNDVSAGLIAFIRWKPDLLFKFDPKVDSKAFPTPRSWISSEDFTKSKSLPGDLKYELLKGTVGDGPAAEYWAFLRLINELPTLEEIEKNPKKARLPDESKLDCLYAITTLMGTNANDKNFDAFCDYVLRMPTEFQVVFMKDAATRNAELRTSRRFREWAKNNHDVIVHTTKD